MIGAALRQAPAVRPDVFVRPARPADMEAVAVLVNGFAAQNLMLPKSPEQLNRTFREFQIATDRNGRFLGCGALRVFTPQLAEIVSLAVSPEAHGGGVGGQIVEALVGDAEALGIGAVFALTLRPGFFDRLGFRTVEKEVFPQKVWADCSICPKQQACDEIAVVREL